MHLSTNLPKGFKSVFLMKFEVFQTLEVVLGRVQAPIAKILSGADAPVAPATAVPLGRPTFIDFGNFFLALWS